MRIVINGAGNLGNFLASTFCRDGHDVVVIDLSGKTLKRVKDKFDVMTVQGDGSLAPTLREAQCGNADLFFGVTDGDTVNIHSCQLAKSMGAKTTFCRLSSSDLFAVDDGIMPGKFGIDHVVVQPEICSRKVLNILDNPAILDKILFSAPEALMTAVRIFPSSPLAGVKLREFPRSDLVREVRFALAIRQERTFAPNGETVFVAGDEVYVSGSRECVGKMVDWISSPSPRLSRIVVAGGTRLGAGLVRELSELGYPVRLIEENYERSERILDELRARVMVINGDPNEQDILLEAGVTDECDLFVATQDDDENNILSGILAKGMGAKKVVVFTNKPEYIDIMRGIRSIDCGFSRRLVAVNTILRNLASGTVRTEALLHRAKASVIEFEIRPDSPLCNSPIDACRFPDSTVLAFVYRDGSVIPPVGNLVLLSGDLVATVATVANSRNLEAFFKSRTLLSS